MNWKIWRHTNLLWLGIPKCLIGIRSSLAVGLILGLMLHLAPYHTLWTSIACEIINDCSKLHRNWASPSNLLGLVEYDTYDAEDFQIFLDSYLYCKPPTCYWGPLDFGKPGLESASPNHTVSWVAMDGKKLIVSI